MKTVNINFVGFWGSFKKNKNAFYDILKKKYDVQISDEPDYLFVSPLGNRFEYTKYDCIRIMFAGEEIVPDFNAFDYAIGFDDISFGDRYIRYPFCFFGEAKPWKYMPISKEQGYDLLHKKDIFCNLIYRENSIGGMRWKLFEALNRYKPVKSYGPFLNNVGGKSVTYREKNKILRRSKFTLAIEGCNYPGVITEKLTAPFECHSVPIYFGNVNVCNDFSEQSFVNVHDYNNVEDLVEYIKELDSNDEKYVEMLCSQPLITPDYAENLYNSFEAFIYNIFDQDYDTAKRRVCSAISSYYSKLDKRLFKITKFFRL